MAGLFPCTANASLGMPTLPLRGFGMKMVLTASVLVVAGCKSEEEKFTDAAETLWGELEDEHATFSEAITADDSDAAADSLSAVEQMMLDFDAEHLGDRMCGWDRRLVCYRHLVKPDSHPVVIKFMEAYSGVERMGSVFEINFPGKLEELRGSEPESGIDADGLLPPPPSGN